MAYARRHPYKVFFAVIMPLVSGGLLHKLAQRFGIHLPRLSGSPGGSRGGFSGGGYANGGVERGRGGGGGGGGYYGSEGYGPERGMSNLGGFGGWDVQTVAGGIGTAAGTIGSLASLAKMASQFM